MTARRFTSAADGPGKFARNWNDEESPRSPSRLSSGLLTVHPPRGRVLAEVGQSSPERRRHMIKNRWLWALLTMLVGGLQAWDSGALLAGSTAQLLIALGVAIPALAIWTFVDNKVWIAGLV